MDGALDPAKAGERLLTRVRVLEAFARLAKLSDPGDPG
jgi:hypothetical protein